MYISVTTKLKSGDILRKDDSGAYFEWHILTPAVNRQKQEEHCEFLTVMGFIMRFRSAWATELDHVSKNNNAI